MAGTRRGTRASQASSPSITSGNVRNLRSRAAGKNSPAEGSDKENTPPKHDNTIDGMWTWCCNILS